MGRWPASTTRRPGGNDRQRSAVNQQVPARRRPRRSHTGHRRPRRTPSRISPTRDDRARRRKSDASSRRRPATRRREGRARGDASTSSSRPASSRQGRAQPPSRPSRSARPPQAAAKAAAEAQQRAAARPRRPLPHGPPPRPDRRPRRRAPRPRTGAKARSGPRRHAVVSPTGTPPPRRAARRPPLVEPSRPRVHARRPVPLGRCLAGRLRLLGSAMWAWAQAGSRCRTRRAASICDDPAHLGRPAPAGRPRVLRAARCTTSASTSAVDRSIHAPHTGTSCRSSPIGYAGWISGYGRVG